MIHGWKRLGLGLTLVLALCSCNSRDLNSSDELGLLPTLQDGTGALEGNSSLDEEELAFLGLINQYRVQNGLRQLQLSIALTQAADWMSNDMASKNYFDHTDSQGRDPFARIGQFGYSYSGYSGENIAAGNASASNTFTQWRNSAGHNANMLSSSYKVIGIGRAYNAGSSYRWYWTTDFGGYVDAVLSN